MLPTEFSHKLSNNYVPFDVSFELTYRCNQQCLMCYQPDHQDSSGELTTTEVKDILDQLAEAGCLFLAFTGGEPFLRPDFLEIIEYASQKSFAINIQTNGTFFTSSLIRRLKQLNILQVHLSLLGARAETHNSITGLSNSFSRVINAARQLREQGIEVFFKITVIKNNLTELEEMIALSKSLDCQFFISPIIVPMDNGNQQPFAYRITDEGMQHLFGITKEEVTKDLHFIPEEAEPVPEFGLCTMAKSTCAINPKGELYPCLGMPVPVGNLRKIRFSELWKNSEELRNLRGLDVADMKNCMNCRLNDSCLYCPGLSYLETGDCLEPAEELCRIARIIKETK